MTKQFRLTWVIIERSVIAVMKYMFIPALLVFNFTISKTMVGDYRLQFSDRFQTNIFDEYQQVFGENQEDLADQKPSIITMYMLGTFLINIVVLNILISVVTDNYDIVMQRIAAEDY